jgi:DNA-binding MarR family transcriptional regulator
MNTICKIRDIYMAIGEFETYFVKEFNLSLNEGMLLCSLQEKGELTSTSLAKELQLTCSNTSKVIKSVEEKEYIERKLGKEDKREMRFSLTPKGNDVINHIKASKIEIPKELKRVLK